MNVEPSNWVTALNKAATEALAKATFESLRDEPVMDDCAIVSSKFTDEKKIKEIIKKNIDDDCLMIEDMIDCAASNPSISSKLLEYLEKKTYDFSLIPKHINTPLTVLLKMADGADNKRRIDTLANPTLPQNIRQSLVDALFGDSPVIDGNIWIKSYYQKKYESELLAAKRQQKPLFFSANPDKAVASRRPLAVLLALSSGPYVEASRIVRVAGSTDWMIRAAVARNQGTPRNVLKKLSADAHPLVAALALKSLRSNLQETLNGSLADSLNLARIENELLERMQGKGMQWTCVPILNSIAWRERANLNEVLNWLTRLGIFDDLLAQFLAGLDLTQRDFFWQWAVSAQDVEVRMRLVQHSDVPLDALVRFTSDQAIGVLFALIATGRLPVELQSKVENSAIRVMKKGGQAFKECNAAAAPLALRDQLAAINDGYIKRGLEYPLAYPAWLIASGGDEPVVGVLTEADDIETGERQHRELRARHSQDWLNRLRLAFQREFDKREGKPASPFAPLSVDAVFSALTWLGYVPASPRLPSGCTKFQKSELRKSARSTDWLTRLGAALHPTATKDILEVLQKDCDLDVVRAAMSRKATIGAC